MNKKIMKKFFVEIFVVFGGVSVHGSAGRESFANRFRIKKVFFFFFFLFYL